MNPWEKGVWCVTTALTAAVLVKLWSSGLVKLYRLLFSFLASDCIFSIAGLFIPYLSREYAHYYFTAQTVKIVIAALMVVEIYSLALERQPALAQFVRGIIGYILLGAALIPGIALWNDHSAAAQSHPYIRYFFLFEQTMDATMAIFLILISVFLAWFPLRMRRNVILYISGFIMWSLSRSALLLTINRFFNNKQLISVSTTIQMSVALGCLLYWLIGLKREGEARTAVVGHLWNRAEADRLTQQLDAINAGLTRLRRK
jgi:hypothetical protein